MKVDIFTSLTDRSGELVEDSQRYFVTNRKGHCFSKSANHCAFDHRLKSLYGGMVTSNSFINIRMTSSHRANILRSHTSSYGVFCRSTSKKRVSRETRREKLTHWQSPFSSVLFLDSSTEGYMQERLASMSPCRDLNHTCSTLWLLCLDKRLASIEKRRPLYNAEDHDSSVLYNDFPLARSYAHNDPHDFVCNRLFHTWHTLHSWSFREVRQFCPSLYRFSREDRHSFEKPNIWDSRFSSVRRMPYVLALAPDYGQFAVVEQCLWLELSKHL